jgi:8-oxo-dGTP diphosphatase
MTQVYALGFAFDSKQENILLITKNRPAWQAGKWNGIGGKVEPGELPINCMIREFEEETGLRTEAAQWSFITVLDNPHFVVHAYCMRSDDIFNAKTMTDEVVTCAPVQLDLIRMHSLSNLSWLIGLALDADQPRMRVTVNYD